MSLYRVHGDDAGQSHLSPVHLPPAEPDAGPPGRRTMRDIPATTMTITELLEPKPDNGLHRPPRRQLVVVLRGEMEVTTTTGQSVRLGPGDVLFAEDLESRGHVTRDVGPARLSTLTVGLDDEWALPSL